VRRRAAKIAAAYEARSRARLAGGGDGNGVGSRCGSVAVVAAAPRPWTTADAAL
jgi:hypothetical protein